MKTAEIKVGIFNRYFPVSKLAHSIVNRDIVEKHADQFKRKIEKYGFLVPITIDQYGNIVEGHHRALMAFLAGLETVPVYIVNWIDTNDLDEYQEYIINLNNANRSWTALDYLKTFSRNKSDYKYVFNQYNKTKDVLSVGNLLNIYFCAGCNQSYKKGISKIRDLNFSNYIFNRFYDLRKKYGSTKIQAFTINRTCSFAHQKVKGNLKEMKYILDQIEQLAENNNATLSSVEHIKPFLTRQLQLYREITNDKKKLN